MLDLLRKIFPSANQRRISEYTKIVKKINALEEEMSSKDENFFKELHFDEKPDEEKFSHIFASVREASVRTLGLRHFDCQMIGGLVLKDGNIAEMKTGEGKTLVATLPAVLNALNGKKVYVVTVNDYLAERDAAWMAPIYEYFGLKVSALTSTQSFEEKKSSYESNIIYCTSSELGFDYLRDNMVLFRNQKSQADLNFAIIDEVDSILIDEARTPLIISGATDDDASAYPVFLKLIPNLKQQLREGTDEEPLSEEEKGDFLIDEKGRSVELTENGFEKVENFLVNRNMIKEDESLYTTNNLKFLKYIQATLKANYLFEKDVHYVKEGNKVVLIDDNTGRKLPGRRISEGVHQALECKEKVPIQQETQTLASTTFQNYFRLFDQISGMTGTADTEAAEFKQIYNMSVVVIPTNQTMVREDVNDVVYVNEEDKYSALLSEIKEINKKEAPILVGTASIESSEKVSSILKKAGIKHQVLNAKYHEKEAMIIEEAGRPGAITIATNMAGRGTDIVLGGKKEDDKEWNQNHQKVIDAGGLHVIGTERHESRRIDNQLRGRSGRQGDPGYSKFFLSLDDTVLRLFIDENRKQLFSRLSEGMDDSSIEHPLLNGAIANAQKKIENRNFEIRKQILEYDDVSNDQRLTVYKLRNFFLEDNDNEKLIFEYLDNLLEKIADKALPE
ncbi:MAG: preprotein translocase subunit SecA, partial [Pseudomonadota bacterium]|nr:preprotein translocase subunit SecA [Pseudomonadota bacterium]